MDLSASSCVVNGVVTLNCAPLVIVNILTWIFALAGFASLIFIILGGFKFLTSGGEKEKVEEARKTITWALIGLILIFLSFAIVRLIGQATGVTCISKPFDFTSCQTPGVEPPAVESCLSQPPPTNCTNYSCNLSKGEWECTGGK